MNIGVIGGKDWSNYQSLIRTLTITIEELVKQNPEDTRIIFVHSPKGSAEMMVTEFINKTERYMKQKGYSIKEKLLSPDFNTYDKNASHERDMQIINNELSKLLIFAEKNCKRSDYALEYAFANNIPVEIIRY